MGSSPVQKERDTKKTAHCFCREKNVVPVTASRCFCHRGYVQDCKAKDHAEPAGNKRQYLNHDEGFCQQQDAEYQADDTQHAIARILRGKAMVQVNHADEAGPEPEEDNKKNKGEDCGKERVQEDEGPGDDIDHGKKDFHPHIRTVNEKTPDHEQATDKPVGAEEGDEEFHRDSRGKKKHQADKDCQYPPQEQEPPGEEFSIRYLRFCIFFRFGHKMFPV